MNHCLLEVQVKKAPTIRYTQDNKTPIAEMEVLFEGLRADDSPGELKVERIASINEIIFCLGFFLKYLQPIELSQLAFS